MRIIELKRKPGIYQNKKLELALDQFEKLLAELSNRELPEEIILRINSGIDRINSVLGDEKALKKQLKKTQSEILKLLEKKLKLVTKNYYRNTWTALGMAAFGVPLGVAFGSSMDNMGLIGAGIPIGMVLGRAMGANMDKKAKEVGNQLDLEIKY